MINYTVSFTGDFITQCLSEYVTSCLGVWGPLHCFSALMTVRHKK